MITISYAYISEENHSKLMQSYSSNFSTEFLDKISRYRRWQDAQLSLLGRTLLVKGLEEMGIRFDDSTIKYTPFNKPYIDESDVHFNISHSGSVVVCALTDSGEVGIDIEKINPLKLSSFKSQMTNEEWRLINESKDDQLSFFNYWSQKEAVIKAHGNGLSIPLKSFEIKNYKTTIGEENFFVKEIAINNEYSCHLAFKECLDSIEIKLKQINF